MDDFLIKPFNPDKQFAAISRWLERTLAGQDSFGA
jgi:hypothetical protein